jgi:hypothetical protein
MRLLPWMTLAVSAVFAAALGVYVEDWVGDAYPQNVVLFGHRLTTTLLLGFGACLAALAALVLSLRRGRRNIASGIATSGTRPGLAIVAADPLRRPVPIRTTRVSTRRCRPSERHSAA